MFTFLSFHTISFHIKDQKIIWWYRNWNVFIGTNERKATSIQLCMKSSMKSTSPYLVYQWNVQIHTLLGCDRWKAFQWKCSFNVWAIYHRCRWKYNSFKNEKTQINWNNCWFWVDFSHSWNKSNTQFPVF